MSGFGLGFRSLDHEVRAVELPVTGRFPAWLAGTLVRNGPAGYEAGERRLRHWFDGQAMLHRFALADGRVTYANRYLDTPSGQAVRRRETIRYREFATDPCRSVFARFTTPFRPRSANANVNVTAFGDRWVALTEAPLPVEFDPATLDTLGVVDYRDRLAGQLTTAHPHRDPSNGDLLNYVTHFARRSEYRVYRQRPDGPVRRELIGRHQVDEPGYMHSFAVTERHLVLVEFPLVVSPLALLLSGRPFIENYRWRPERGTRFLVMDRADGRMRAVLHGPACFAFHHVNAWEEPDGRIAIDLCAYPDSSVIDAFYLDALRSGGAVPQAVPTRFVLDPRAGSVTGRPLSAEPLELPRIAYRRRNGRRYRYAYGVGSRDGGTGDFFNQLVKLDATDGTTLLWREPDCYPGEPVFVPAPPAGGGDNTGNAGNAAYAGYTGDADAPEDDGIVLSVVLRPASGTSYLLALDAATFQERARAELPHAVPFGFHGAFVPDRPRPVPLPAADT